jgi:predicted nuclease of predicted toxin-antitoxin system
LKVLLDECVDARLAAFFTQFVVRTVHDQGWSRVTNGKLLTLAQAEFDLLVTVDRNLAFQQHIPKFSLAVVLVHSVSNRISDLAKLIPEIENAVSIAKQGVITEVGR